MANEGFDEDWDADFVNELVIAEEAAISQKHLPPQQPHTAVPYTDVSYSPPRELSQRVPDFSKCINQSSSSSSHANIFSSTSTRNTLPIPCGSHTAHEQEIDYLKKELDKVKKQLTLVEEERIELRMERDREKEKRPKLAFSKSVNLYKGYEVEAECLLAVKLIKEEHIQYDPHRAIIEECKYSLEVIKAAVI